VKMIHKYAHIIEQKPFHMMRAASELKLWVDEKDGGTPLLDVSYCKLELCRSRAPSTMTPVTDLSAAVALEVEPGVVTLGKPPVPKAGLNKR
jgi:hypothetical protein